MINAMLVAGSKTDGLKKFFKEKKSVNIEYAYTNLKSNSRILADTMIRLDKLIYVAHDLDDSFSIKSELEVLNSLLKSDVFFSVDEIILFYNDGSKDNPSKERQRGLEYFQAVMKSNDFTNYHVRRYNEEVSFLQIYDEVLGVTVSVNIKNEYDQIFLMERSSAAESMYDQDPNNKKIEPFDYERLRRYEKSKELASKSDSGRTIVDNNDGVTNNFMEKSLNLTKIEVSDLLSKRNIFVVSGEYKSGTTTYSNALTVSSLRASKNVLVIDLSDNPDSRDYLVHNDIPLVDINLTNAILRGELHVGTAVAYLNLTGRSSNFKLDYLASILTRLNDTEYDCVFIETHKDLLIDVISLSSNKLNRVFYTIENLVKELKRSKEFIDTISKDTHTVLMLNSILVCNNTFKRLDNISTKKIFSNDVKVINPISFNNYQLDEKLYYKLVGGRLWE